MSKVATVSPAPVPRPLEDWLGERHARSREPEAALVPGGGRGRDFIYATVPLVDVTFRNHTYNPRTPNEGKVRELAASIQTLSLLTPLTCAYLSVGEQERIQRGRSKPSGTVRRKNPGSSPGEADTVVLLDGRHRLDALKLLAEIDRDWARDVRVDLKIYYGLNPSDVYLLATYLNKTRKALAKGEYYKFIVEIFDRKKSELESASGKSVTERQVFESISARELTDKNADLSVGRIVGLVAFDPEENGSWYPMVGVRQQEMIPVPTKEGPGYCPVTAGNLATFLSNLCSTAPYEDNGALRSTEIVNALRLGELFRRHVLAPVPSYDQATPASVCCKHWCISAFGFLLNQWKADLAQTRSASPRALLANDDLRWVRLEELVVAYVKVMTRQSAIVNRYRESGDLRVLKEAWSYQTEREQVRLELEPALREEVGWLGRVKHAS